MMTWHIDDAQTNFTKLLQACDNAPQILNKHEQPIAVIMNFNLFTKLMQLQTPTIAELIEKLETINVENPIDFALTPRTDRQNSLLENENEVFGRY